MVPSFFDHTDDAAIEEVLRQAGLELKGGHVIDNSPVVAPPPLGACVELPQEKRDEDTTNHKKVANFWKNKYNHLKEENGDLEKLKHRLQDYEAMHKLDAYKLHRLCADLREKQRASAARELDATRCAKELKQTATSLEEKVALLMKDKEKSVMRDISQEERRDGAVRSEFNAELQQENEKLRYDLSVRCKVLWQLGEAQRLSETQLEELQDEVAKAGLREQQAIESRKDEERMVACLSREVEAAGEEIDILRDGLKSRDEQTALLVAAVNERSSTVEELRCEAEAREQRIHSLLSKNTPPELTELQEENENLRIQLASSRNAFQEARKTASQATSDLAKHKTHLASVQEASVAAHKKKLLAVQEELANEKHERTVIAKKLQELDRKYNGLLAKSSTEKLVECEKERDEALNEVGRLQKEESRLKHYITTLGSRLDTVTGQLEMKNAKLRQQEAGAPTISPNRMVSIRSPFSARSVSPNVRQGRSPMHRGL